MRRQTFPGVVELLSTERPLDVLFVHGMCSHDAGWARGAVQGFYESIGGAAGQWLCSRRR